MDSEAPSLPAEAPSFSSSNVVPHSYNLYAMEARVYLIRHGATAYHETGIAARDDPLSSLGRSQADALQPILAGLLDISVVLVSPLDRALETALRAFAHRPDVRFVVVPALREFNMRQKSSGSLFARHMGVPLRVLKARYNVATDSTSDGPRRTDIEWPAGVEDDFDWWEPHGTFTDADEPGSVVSRVQSAAALIWAHVVSAGDRRVAVVAHENVFRALTGWPRFPTAQLVPVAWLPPSSPTSGGTLVVHTVTPCSARESVALAFSPESGGRHSLGGFRGSTRAGLRRLSSQPAAEPAADLSPVALTPVVRDAGPISIPRPSAAPLRCSFVCASVTDQRALERRIYAALAFAASHPDEFVIVSASPQVSS